MGICGLRRSWGICYILLGVLVAVLVGGPPLSPYRNNSEVDAVLPTLPRQRRADKETALQLAELDLTRARLDETRKERARLADEVAAAAKEISALRADIVRESVVQRGIVPRAPAFASYADGVAAAKKRMVRPDTLMIRALKPRPLNSLEPLAPAAPVPPERIGGAPFPPPPKSVDDYDFADTAIVTMVAGDEAARGVITLVQSLRDVQTRVQDVVVIVIKSGRDRTSDQYLSVLSERLGTKLALMPEIPSTQWTQGIPGGRGTFWGMALNKLHVFNMTQYKKLLWMDGDTLVLKNVDHLFLEPMFTAAFTYACCNANGPAIPSGGLWVVEPSVKVRDGTCVAVRQLEELS